MKKTITIFFFILICSLFLYAQENETKIPSLQNEKWWGAFVAKGSVMPWKDTPTLLDLHNQNFNNQTVPLFLSDKGRYIWCEKPFQFTVKDGDIYIKTAPQNIEIVNGGSTLREAYLAASVPISRLPGSFRTPFSFLCRNTIPGSNLCTIKISRTFSTMPQISSGTIFRPVY